MKITSQIKENVVSGGSSSDKMTNYVIAIENVDIKINDVIEEIRTLKKDYPLWKIYLIIILMIALKDKCLIYITLNTRKQRRLQR